MSEWIIFEKTKPKNCQRVIVKTDCDKYPLAIMWYVNEEFLSEVIIQCDIHHETDEKLYSISIDKIKNGFENYSSCITHWMPLKETEQ